MSENIRFIQGNEACVEGALYAGVEFLLATRSHLPQRLQNIYHRGYLSKEVHSFRWKMGNPRGVKGTTGPYLTIDSNFDVVALAKAAGATFVARSTAYHAKSLAFESRVMVQ